MVDIQEALHSGVDSELVFIGSCFTDTEVLADTSLVGSDFDNPNLGRLFDRMRERQVSGLGVSQALLVNDFPAMQRDIWGATDFISEVALAEYHGKVIRDRSVRRKLKQAAIRITAMADGNDVDGIVDQARAEVDSALRGDERSAASMVDDAVKVLAEYRQEVDLIPSPWRSLNEVIEGFGPGRMYVIGARPGVGKSAVASQIAYSLAEHGPVIFATMEMSKGEVYARIVSQQDGLHLGRGDHSSQFVKDREAAWLRDHVRDIRVIDHGTQTVASIRSAARSASRDGNLAGIIVDYIHLLTTEKSENETVRIAGITRALKQLAMDLKVPVIALSQLNRAVTGRDTGRPGLGDLRGSGSIEQDGDAVIFLYKTIGEEEVTLNDTVNVYVGKNRQGPSFVGFKLTWQGDFVRAVDPD